MYLNHYKLTKEPFNITPDPEFLFLSASHKEAIAAIIYGVEQRKGFIAIVGEVGVGKTTILRSYLKQIDREKVCPIYLFNSNVTFVELLTIIGRALGLEIQTNNQFETINKLHEQLIHEYRKGRNIVLIIDEAQNMSVDVLENLRMLSNLETTKDKLIQIVFSAQPEFDQLLNRNELRQLRQRIAVKTTIRPLTRDESLAYISHRLSKAVTGDASIFSSAAMKLVADHAKGIPRTINILCDNSLITSFGYKRKTVNERVVKEIISDFKTSDKDSPKWRPALVVSLLGIICLIGMILYLVISVFKSGSSQAAEKAQIKEFRQEQVGKSQELVSPEPLQTTVPKAGIEGATLGKERLESASMIVKKGDTLAKLIAVRYGHVSRSMVERIKRNNPGITHADRIVEGDRIYFPVEKHK